MFTSRYAREVRAARDHMGLVASALMGPRVPNFARGCLRPRASWLVLKDPIAVLLDRPIRLIRRTYCMALNPGLSETEHPCRHHRSRLIGGGRSTALRLILALGDGAATSRLKHALRRLQRRATARVFVEVDKQSHTDSEDPRPHVVRVSP